MTLTEQLEAQDVAVDRRRIDGGVEFVADFGAATAASVDVLGDTVIVVAGEDQYELDVAGDAEAFMQNGVLTIEVNE
jgi:hypothetical protein